MEQSEQHAERKASPEDAGLMQQAIHLGGHDQRIGIEIYRLLQDMMQRPHIELAEGVLWPSRDVHAAAGHWRVRDACHVLDSHVPRR